MTSRTIHQRRKRSTRLPLPCEKELALPVPGPHFPGKLQQGLHGGVTVSGDGAGERVEEEGFCAVDNGGGQGGVL